MTSLCSGGFVIIIPMLSRLFAIIGILFALLGVVIAPGILLRKLRRKPLPIHRLNPDESDIPWDLSRWIPVGINDMRGLVPKKEWTWMPRFRRVK